MRRKHIAALAGLVIGLGALVLWIAAQAGAFGSKRDLERELYPGTPPFQKEWSLKVPFAKLTTVSPFAGRVVLKEMGPPCVTQFDKTNSVFENGTVRPTYIKIWIRSGGTDLLIAEDKPDTNLVQLYFHLREGQTYEFPTVMREFNNRHN